MKKPYRLWEKLARKITGKDEYGNDVTEAITNVPVDKIWGDEALFYIPKKDEKLHWQPMPSGREGWQDGGRKRRSQNAEQHSCFLGAGGNNDEDGNGGKQISGEQERFWKDFVLEKRKA